MERSLEFLEVQHIDILPLTLNQCPPSSPGREIFQPLYVRQVGLEGIEVQLLSFRVVWFALCSVQHRRSTQWLFESRRWCKMNDLYLCFSLLSSFLELIMQKAPNSTRYDWCCHLMDNNGTFFAVLGKFYYNHWILLRFFLNWHLL